MEEDYIALERANWQVLVNHGTPLSFKKYEDFFKKLTHYQLLAEDSDSNS
jgi:hypothetical protein